MKIVTGYQGEPHITSNDEQGQNQGIFGSDGYVLNVGNKFATTVVTANEIQIADGEAVMQGVHFRVAPGTYDTVTIENGEQGLKRKDLIVARYTKDASTGVESVEWEVIKGTPAASNPVRPSAISGDILAGDLTADMAMYEVVLNGINLSAINPLFSTLVPQSTLLARVSAAETGISNLNSKIDAITYTTVSKENVSISANSYTDISETLTRTGYTPIGVVGFVIFGSSACWLTESRISSGTLTARVRNSSGSAVTLTGITFTILWKASS